MNERAFKIITLIEEQNISYSTLSKRTGISKSALQRYATGVTEKIPLDRLVLMAAALNATPEFLMGWEGSKEGITELKRKEKENLEELNTIFAQLPEIFQNLALEQMRTLAKVISADSESI
jgi:Helix-turn-helix.